jgi:uncharacterized coiled-coil protein SlyX
VANTKTPKKGTTKTVKKTVKPKRATKQPKKILKSNEQLGIPHPGLEKTREQLKILGEKFGEAADKGLHDSLVTTKKQLGKLGEKLQDARHKGMHFAREIAEEVHRFATDATDLTKTKIEIHNLKKEREILLQLMGEKLKNLSHAGQLTNVKSKFRYDLKKLDELEAAIAEKEKDAEALSLDIKSIK